MPTSSDRAYTRLRSAIFAGDFTMGSRLGEVELASYLGTSRTPIREALRRLAAEGLVEIQPNRGARVSSWSPGAVNEVFELRALLESYGAGLAASHITLEALQRMEELCDLMETITELADERELTRLHEANFEFHSIVLAASASERLPMMVSAVTQVPLALRTFSRYSPAALARSRHHHRELVSALQAHDQEWASSVMRAHILAARNEVACWVDEDLEETDVATLIAAKVD